MTIPLLELRQITVSFDGFLALRDLNLSLQPGELRAVIGPNGAGNHVPRCDYRQNIPHGR